jgi:hypothetical protein
VCKHLTGKDDHPYHCEKCGNCRYDVVSFQNQALDLRSPSFNWIRLVTNPLTHPVEGQSRNPNLDTTSCLILEYMEIVHFIVMFAEFVWMSNFVVITNVAKALHMMNAVFL